MFTTQERDRLRDLLVEWADTDERVVGAAITGSAALGGQDRWSDIDLAFCVDAEFDVGSVIADWTDRMYQQYSVLDHLDVTHGATIYRVFPLASTLQVDLAFSPAAEFGALGPCSAILFGTLGNNRRRGHPRPSN